MAVSDSQEIPLSPDTPRGERKKNRKHRPRKSRWRKWLWVLPVLAILAGLGNGPIFRWGAKKALTKALGKMALTGEVTVEGTLLGGPVLSAAQFTGDKRIRELVFDRVTVDYSLGAALKRDWPHVLEKITVENPRILIDKSRPKHKRNEADPANPNKPGDPWALTAFRDVQVDLTGLDLEILRREPSDSPEWKIDNASLSLADGGKGLLTLGSVSFPDGRSYTDLLATLRINTDTVSIDGPELGEQLAVKSLIIAKPPEDSAAAFSVNAMVDVFGGTVAASHAQGSNAIDVELANGAIDLAGLTAMFGVRGVDAATLEELEALVTFAPKPADGSKPAPPAITGIFRVTDFRGYKLPVSIASAAGNLDLRIAGRALDLRNLRIETEGNRLTGDIAARVPAKGESSKAWLDALTGSLAFDGPEATRFLAAYDVPIEAKAALKVDFGFKDRTLEKLTGKVELTDIAKGEATADSLVLDLTLAAPDLIRADLLLNIDPEKSNTAKLGGTIALDRPAYTANLVLALADLAKLQPAAAEFGAKDLALAGDAHLYWEGSGTLDSDLVPDHHGEATLSPSTFRINGGDPITASLSANYEPGMIEVEQLNATLGDLSVEGGLAWDESLLTLSGVRVRNGETELARADASIPLSPEALRSPEALFAQEAPLNLKVISTALPLDEIFKSLNQESKARGTLTANVSASGTFAEPSFNGTVDIADLVLVGLDDLKRGALHLDIVIAERNATIEGSLTHPDINPISISARAPFAPREWIETPESMKDAAIEAEIRLPDNPLAVIQPLLPDVNTVEGSFSTFVSVGGTLASPVLTGSLTVASPLIAFDRQKIPTVRDIDIDLQFADNALAIRTFAAEVAGGPVAVSGSIELADMANPNLDITLTARQVLVARDDDLSIRANADLTLAGPYKAAALAGRIGITESRFFRNIEILPVGFLRPAAAPAARRASFTPPAEPSITAEPFAAWTLDVTVGTDTPFLVRGNRAEADIEGEIHITGTAAAPVPEGGLRITEGEATLPFSKLGLQESSVTFSPATGFRSPQLNILGVSEIRSYRIQLRVYGTATDPNYLLTSDPPLPQEEIISLLATGSTTSELGDSNVLASKAASLLLEELGKKIKNLTGSDTPDLPLPDRLEFEVLGTDPRTGQTATTTTFKLTDKIHIVGAIDQSGHYRGLLKFLVRFE